MCNQVGRDYFKESGILANDRKKVQIFILDKLCEIKKEEELRKFVVQVLQNEHLKSVIQEEAKNFKGNNGQLAFVNAPTGRSSLSENEPADLIKTRLEENTFEMVELNGEPSVPPGEATASNTGLFAAQPKPGGKSSDKGGLSESHGNGKSPDNGESSNSQQPKTLAMH